MKVKYSKIFVDDQDKALKFYTGILGFSKKSDITNEDYRWLTMVSPDDRDGIELILEKNDNPAAKTYQKAIYEQNMPAANLVTTDVKKEFERLEKLGVKFEVEPTEVMGGVTIAVLNDNCGNLIQIQNV